MSTQGAVLFDLDGTLLDTAEDFIAVVRALCAEKDRAPPSAIDIRNTVSDGARALVTLAFGIQTDHPNFDALRQRLLDIYETELGKHSPLFPGMQNTLNALNDRGIPWGIVTNKPRRFAEPLLQRLALNPAAQVLVTPDDVSQTKPHPEPLLLAAKTLNCTAERSIYVGDHSRDIESGRAANMLTVAAAYGYVENLAQAQAWQADFLIEHAGALTGIINAHFPEE